MTLPTFYSRIMNCNLRRDTMATKVTSKKANSVNNRPNCLKVTKRMQKVNLQTVTTADGKKIKTSAREARAMKKNSK